VYYFGNYPLSYVQLYVSLWRWWGCVPGGITTYISCLCYWCGFKLLLFLKPLPQGQGKRKGGGWGKSSDKGLQLLSLMLALIYKFGIADSPLSGLRYRSPWREGLGECCKSGVRVQEFRGGGHEWRRDFLADSLA